MELTDMSKEQLIDLIEELEDQIINLKKDKSVAKGKGIYYRVVNTRPEDYFE